jgi:hypothetical protein
LPHSPSALKANIYKELEVCFPIVVTYYFVLFLQLIDICTRGGVNCEEVVVCSVITFDRLIAVVDSNKMVFDAASQFLSFKIKHLKMPCGTCGKA